MLKSNKKVTVAPTSRIPKKQQPKRAQPARSSCKRKPEVVLTSSEESSDTDPPYKPHKKRPRQLAEDETVTVEDRPSVEPDLVSDSSGDDTTSSDGQV
jgi:hypothetical protein